MEEKTIKRISWVLGGLVILLLVLHTLKLSNIIIDNTSVFLLILIVICILLPRITEIGFAGIKAKISQGEVEQLKDNVAKNLPERPEVKDTISKAKFREAIQTIINLVDTDSILALAKLRIEIEKVLMILYKASGLPEEPDRSYGVARLAQILIDKEILPRGLAGTIGEVNQLCNRAIHGERINASQAGTIVEQGVRLLGYLYDKLSEFRFTPKDTQEITKEGLNKYEGAKYKVVTVIPYVDKPVKNTYILNQEALNRLMEGYEEYAEFIVEVSKIEE